MTIEEYKEIFKEFPAPKAKKYWERDFHSMIVHTRGGHSKKLIGMRRPNEDVETFNYRIANDRDITRDAFVTAITNLQRTMSHSSVEIRYPEKIKPFLTTENFEGTDFISFIQRRVIKSMIEAANACLVWWPFNVGDVTRQVDMLPIIVFPENIIHWTKDVFTFLSSEKSEIIVDGQPQMIGTVHYIITPEELWKRKQTGKKGEEEYLYEVYYTNPIGNIYALPLGGDETSEHVDGEEIRYLTSYMSSALAFADEAKVQFSDHQGVMVNCAFPIREVEAIKCVNPSCKNGKVYDERLKEVRGDGYHNCSVCDGRGIMAIPNNPYGVVIRPKNENPLVDDKRTDIPVMRFIHPDVSILQFGAESVEKLLKRTEDALNLLFLDEAQSGIAKNIDREDKLAWLDKIAVNIYKYLVPNSVKIIYKFLYPGEDYPNVTVNLPSTFVVKSESDMIADLAAIRNTGLPDFMLIDAIREFTEKKYGGDPVRMKKYEVLLFIDPVANKTFSEKMNMLNAGAITDADLQFSVNASIVLENFIRENSDFQEMSVEEIASKIVPIIQAKVRVIPPRVEDFGS